MTRKLIYVFFLILCATLSIAQTATLVRNINPTGNGLDSRGGMVKFQNQLYFGGQFSTSSGTYLFESNGTYNGTKLNTTLDSINTGYLSNFLEYDSLLYFNAVINGDTNLYVSNGDSANAILIKSNVSSFDKVGYSGKVYFGATGGIWVTDGTVGGTQLFKNLFNGAALEFILYNNLVYFTNRSEIWRTNGVQTDSIQFGFNYIGNFTKCQNLLFYVGDDGSAAGLEIWRTNGEIGFFNNQLLHNINPGGDALTQNSILHAHDNNLYFFADNGVSVGLHKADSNYLSGQLLDTVMPPAQQNFVSYNNAVYFFGKQNATGEELWVTKGNATTTQLVSDLFPGTQGSISIIDKTEFYTFNNRVCYSANSNAAGYELHIISSKGIRQSSNVNIFGHSNPTALVEYAGEPYFAANNGIDGIELFKLDSGSICPDAITDYAYTNNAQSVITDPLRNDMAFNDSITVIGMPSNGFATISNDNLLDYQPFSTFTGLDSVKYLACNTITGCCDSSVIYITVDTVGACYDCVWPGDANDDGIVNNYDVLALGISYNHTGTYRSIQNTIFNEHSAYAWLTNTMGGANSKYVDGNGNGKVDSFDLQAIVANYSQAHAKHVGQRTRILAPQLSVNLGSSYALPGAAVSGPIQFGSNSVPATNIYALAFSIFFDPLLVDSGSINIDFSNSWLGNSSPLITLTHIDYSAGRVDVALTRIDHQSIQGHGSLGTFGFVTEENLAGKGLANEYILDIEIGNATAIDQNGNLLPFNINKNTIIISDVEDIVNSSIKIYPNPAKDFISFSHLGLRPRNVAIYDITGKTIRVTHNLNQNENRLDISELSGGIYYLALTFEDKVVQKVFLKD